jgi:hypothetical protein
VRRYPQPDPDAVTVIAVHCFGCGRKLGVAAEARWKTYVYCSDLCYLQEQLVSLEHAGRDRMIRRMSELGVTQVDIAAVYDMTRPRIHQILADGNQGDYLQAYRRE